MTVSSLSNQRSDKTSYKILIKNLSPWTSELTIFKGCTVIQFLRKTDGFFYFFLIIVVNAEVKCWSQILITARSFVSKCTFEVLRNKLWQPKDKYLCERAVWSSILPIMVKESRTCCITKHVFFSINFYFACPAACILSTSLHAQTPPGTNPANTYTSQFSAFQHQPMA